LWAVIYKQNGEFIGHCGLQFLEDTPEVELAYAIAKADWHQGLTTEAAKASIK
jgi:ribosomal-protein-alanine N-acetyltransferase